MNHNSNPPQHYQQTATQNSGSDNNLSDANHLLPHHQHHIVIQQQPNHHPHHQPLHQGRHFIDQQHTVPPSTNIIETTQPEQQQPYRHAPIIQQQQPQQHSINDSPTSTGANRQNQPSSLFANIDLNAVLGLPRQDAPSVYSAQTGGSHTHASHHTLHYALVSSNTPTHHVQHNYHNLPGIPSAANLTFASPQPQQPQQQQQQQQVYAVPSPPQNTVAAQPMSQAPPPTTTTTENESNFHQDVLLLVVEQQRRIYHLEEEIQRAHDYITKLQAYAKNLEAEKDKNNKKQSRYWTQAEHQKFLEAIEQFGRKDVKSIAEYVGTRNATQVRTHAQKYYAKIEREMKKKREQQLAGLHKITDAEGNLIPRKENKRRRLSSPNGESLSSDGGSSNSNVDDEDEDEDEEDDILESSSHASPDLSQHLQA